MKIKFGALVVDGRGKIGGHVASKNRAGAYLRTKVTPVNPQTPAQNAVRSRLTSLSQGFRNLTQQQIAAWNNAVSQFAKTDIFGDIKNPTGLNLYVKLNTNLLIANNAILTDPPAPNGAVPSILENIGSGAIVPQLDITLGSVVAGNNVMVVSATAPVSPGINFVKSEYRQIGTFPAASGALVDLTAVYQAKFGNPQINQKIFVSIKFIDTTSGVSSTQQSIATVTAF